MHKLYTSVMATCFLTFAQLSKVRIRTSVARLKQFQ